MTESSGLGLGPRFFKSGSVGHGKGAMIEGKDCQLLSQLLPNSLQKVFSRHLRAIQQFES